MGLQGLDVLTCDVFVPYRDSNDRPRLLDLTRLRKSGACAASRKLQKLALAACEAAGTVDTEATWRAWDTCYMDPFWEAWLTHGRSLGLCMGDEGDDWKLLGEAIGDAVHRPGWRVS